MGTEKIESELYRIFPQARIKKLDKQNDVNIEGMDIFVATSAIIKEAHFNFNLIGVLSIDNSLNRIDFRSSEKTFGLLLGLLGLTDKKIVIQTSLPQHYLFQALVNKDINNFYDEELKHREQLNFPPSKHIGLVKLRAEKEDRVKEISNALFKRLRRYKKRNISILSLNPGQPSKLRGKFYWQILVESDNAQKISKFLKTHLKYFSHSGIIVTVDIDPI
jgi:primosomal protein N' (replication factor Y)